MVDNKLTTSSRCVLAAEKVKSLQGCNKNAVVKRLKDPSHLLSPFVTKFGVMCPLLGFKIQKRDGATGVRQQRSETAMKTFKILKDL